MYKFQQIASNILTKVLFFTRGSSKIIKQIVLLLWKLMLVLHILIQLLMKKKVVTNQEIYG
jgi:hypothetical protein